MLLLALLTTLLRGRVSRHAFVNFMPVVRLSSKKLKVYTNVMLRVLVKVREHVRIKSIKQVLNRRHRMHRKEFHQRVRSLRSSDPRADWKILKRDNQQNKRVLDVRNFGLFL